MKNNILITGGSGNLGSSIIKLGFFKNIFYPSSSELNIHTQSQIEKFLKNKRINTIIHTAAIARMGECEKNKALAIKTNIVGTLNIVNAIKKIKLKEKKEIMLVYISTDGVYKSDIGGYKEDDEKNIFPYNAYGWTKLSAEYAVKQTKNYLIIRGRFFNKENINYKYSATDIYSSGIEIEKFSKIIFKLVSKKIRGVLNIGQNKISDYQKYKKYIKNLKPCKKEKVIKNLSFNIGYNSSLNLNKMKKILNTTS